MKTYLVGGAVRDYLLGLPVKDRDWVVVGADAQTMLAQGFQPVGKDFPVFLHPDTHEEYALARTERKTAKGYAGFSFHADKDVTLEQDLMRRDLTINAMAQDSDGLIDPFGGQQDLAAGILRHVSPAFAEDPVRILRTARFAARYGFEIAGETMRLMRQMVENGEADALVAERYAALLHDLGKAKTPPDILPKHHGHDLNGVEPVREVNQKLRAPRHCAELAELVCRWHIMFHQVGQLKSKTILKVLQKTDAFRRPERFAAALNVCIADTQGRLNREHTPYPQRAHWLALLEAANQVDSGKIAAECRAQGKAHLIAEQIDRARLERIAPLQKAYQLDSADLSHY